MKEEKIKIKIVKDEELKKIVRENYGKIVKSGSSCCTPVNSCCTPVSSCCGSSETDIMTAISKNIGYTDEELNSIPEGTNLGLGCGNPVALASLKEGETVLDLGSGAGIDCFLAANKVGKTGKVIGVDMTPDMISSARIYAKQSNYDNVEFRLGEIEHIPVETSSIDIIISNCVINLVPDKNSAFQEAYRVLKTGGRLMISDIVLLSQLPDFIKESIDAYIGCVAGAVLKEDYIEAMKNAGFNNIEILEESKFPIDVLTVNPKVMEIVKQMNIQTKMLKDIANSVVSIKIRAYKS
jgi:arsenite methyltransferase